MNILSVFDGMSCGQIALNKLNIKYNKYYASEIDKYAIQITKKNYPNTIHLGDVTQVYAKDLPKIDLLIGGSPCQGFSFAGKQLAFDDPRSKLFFEFVRLLKELKPKYFLLENVRMKKEYLDIISEYLGVEPIKINSSLVSAQNRVRYYWTNIPGIDQPKEKGIVLRDILQFQQNNISELSNAKKDRILNSKRGKGFFYNPDHHDKIGTLVAGYAKEPTDGSYLEINKPVKDTERNRRHYKSFEDKSLCLTATAYKGAGNNGMTLVPIQVGMATDINGHDILKRIYSTDGKSPTLNACTGGNREPKIAENKTLYRKLTPIECERLQTVPKNYTEGVSNTQRYKMLGNGWTVDVIAHIFKNMSLQNSNNG